MFCCFCGSELYKGGNSTWPIYPDVDHCDEGKPNGEQMRCCDRCNLKYVIEARRDKTKIMKIREMFGIKCANQ